MRGGLGPTERFSPFTKYARPLRGPFVLPSQCILVWMADSNKAEFEAALWQILRVSKEEMAEQERKPLAPRPPGRKPREA